MNSSMVVLSLFLAVPIHAFSAQTQTQVSSSKAAVFHHPSLSAIDAVSAVTNKQTMCIPKQYNPFNAQRITSALYARPKSKWDDLTDEDDDDDYETNESKSSSSVDVPKDMLYTEANIRRQADTYDQLVAVGGPGVVNDVYAIEKQWPLIERHVWALRLPVRPTSDLSSPFEVWYAPGDSEYDAARNDPNVTFTKVSGLILYSGGELKSTLVGFVGKVYDERRGEPLFFVERNVNDGSTLKGREIVEGDWLLRSEIED
ncbi:predicted protein [Thalassiosira pseudonana CCMP1335]|uniref:Uncharacterized protein n=1 Tax=Thalassiosira pseudonana TaxID=35128 RepID=B8C2J4_THAPS|nr:predicted protein [Thalassiosira pseudonana CCMP1335]EED91958.1 predicted protein [Thalassiosira pseudonana CCMP1335]